MIKIQTAPAWQGPLAGARNRERNNNMKEIDRKKWIPAVLLLAAAFLSVFVLSGIASSPQFHAGTIAALDEKQTTVLELTAASTAASAALTLIPGDTATPIAEKLADLSSCFLVVLCAVYLEKYLLTITGFAAFDFLIPAACLLYLLNLFLDREMLRTLARKLLIFGIAIVLVIPVSVKVSDLIEDTYQASIQATLDAAKETTEAVENSVDESGSASEEGFLSGIISGITSSISGVASGISEKVGDMVNNFMEALAVMLVTSCVIPILVMLFFAWLVKITFSVELPIRAGGMRRNRKSAASEEKSGEEP